jgi:cell division protein FtsL
VILSAAIEKARRLVAELERQQAELDATPGDWPTLPPEKSAEGKSVLANALASARTALAALEDAAAKAKDSQP